MIDDKQTNMLYLSSLLEEKYPKTYDALTRALTKHDIKFEFLKNTKDVWCRDFMPIQVTKDKFIRFRYYSGYIRESKYDDVRTDNKLVCEQLPFNVEQSKIILDGGNVIHYGNKVIVTEMIFKDNPEYSKNDLLNELSNELESEVIVIPKQPYDFTGHVDGMLRFVDENTVIVNDYTGESDTFQNKINRSLDKIGLNTIVMPYDVYDNKQPNGKSDSKSAVGCYVNYLQIGDKIFFPIYNRREDEKALKVIYDTFPQYKIEPVECSELAKEGGVLNCISWNVLV